ncbi:hypothetical protein KCP75_13725 [Salmonella enterica subsp. enterica]|nr:hypothetical protein KCP75_13725 [Salmonella enterica subsp. enterica]
MLHVPADVRGASQRRALRANMDLMRFRYGISETTWRIVKDSRRSTLLKPIRLMRGVFGIRPHYSNCRLQRVEPEE